MDWFASPSITQVLNVDTRYVFRDSSLLLCSSSETDKFTQNIVSELLLNAANRAASQELLVFYFRPCQLVTLTQLHVHGTPAFDFGAWDSIRFFYPTVDSLVRFFSQIHLTQCLPDLIVIEQLDRIIGHDDEDFLARLYSLTCLFADTLEHIHRQTSSPNRTVKCRILVSCALPQNLWRGQSVISANLVPHGLHQACLFTKEDDAAHFCLADVTGAFEFKLLLVETEIFFISFLHKPELLSLIHLTNN